MIDTLVAWHLLSTVSNCYVNYFIYHKGLALYVMEMMRERGFIRVEQCRTSETPIAMGKSTSMYNKRHLTPYMRRRVSLSCCTDSTDRIISHVFLLFQPGHSSKLTNGLNIRRRLVETHIILMEIIYARQ